MNDIFIDIPICTFNHEAFIARAIQGVMSQKVNYKYRMFIGDDASSDNTKAIITEYSNKFPDKIFPIFHSINIGAAENSKVLFSLCTGKYIALLDGDDYWTDPYKLQKQVDFLESHPDFSLCFHKVKVLNDRDEEIKFSFSRNEVSDIYDLAWGNYIHTVSAVFRNIFLNDSGSLENGNRFNDYIIFMTLARAGKLMELNETMAVYRMHNNGLWSGSKEIDKQMFLIRSLQYLLSEFNDDKKLIDILRLQYLNTLFYCAELCRKENEKQKYNAIIDLLKGEADFIMNRYFDLQKDHSDIIRKLNNPLFLAKRIIYLIPGISKLNKLYKE